MYASNVGSGFNLSDYNTVASMQSAILSLAYSSGGTNTATALAYVRTTMLTAAAGDRSNVSNVVVVLTDGHSNNANYTRVSRKCLVSYWFVIIIIIIGLGSNNITNIDYHWLTAETTNSRHLYCHHVWPIA